MFNPEPVLENEMYKEIWDIEIQTDCRVPASQPDVKIVDKKN